MINDKETYAGFYSKSVEHSYGKPNKNVELIPEYLSSGSALDLGAGDGRHAILLASAGFEVKALDTSQVALDKMQRIAKENGVKVEGVLADLTGWSFDTDYDALVAAFILQHLQKEDALRLMDEMRKHTKPNGLNAVSLFTKTGDRYLEDRKDDPNAFYPDDNWLQEYYKDWEILDFETSEATIINRTRKDGSPARNNVEKILARKPVKK
jgi:SAM-dependent methyltransferase